MADNRSGRSLGSRFALTALALGMAAAAIGCSAGSGSKNVSLHPTGAGSATAASPGATTTTPVAGGGSPTSVSGGTAPVTGSATTAHPGAPTGSNQATGPAPAKTSPPTAPKATTPASSGPAPVPPGVYHYSLVSGSSVLTTGTTSTTLAAAPQSTLTVSATGPGTEQWVNAPTTTSSGSSSITTNLVFNSSGVFLTSETVSFPGATATCMFASPVAFPPWPLAPGKTFSGQAVCGQGQSASTLSLSGRVVQTASASVGGTAVSTYMVQSTMTLGTTLTVAETDWYAPSLGLPVKSIIGIQGGIPGYSIATATTYALTSSRPS